MNTIEIILNEIQEVMHLVDEQEIDDVATVLTKDKRIFVEVAFKAKVLQ